MISFALSRLLPNMLPVTIDLGVPQICYHYYHMNHHFGDNDKKGPDGSTKDWSSIYRYGTNDLPIEIPAIISNHPDFAGVAINVSTRQLVEPEEVPNLVRRAIAMEGLRPEFLTLEITESTLIEQLESAQAALTSLKNLGVRLSLDDFGTGYSSLSYLRDLPFDSVKIDRSLIRHIIDFPHAAELASAIVQMGHALELQVIAEGVETAEQVARLRTLECDVAQGYYFAQPMAPERLTALLRDQLH